jgi:choline dehydrogenase-like flavoprotein
MSSITKRVYDAIIVGSGATGGWMAKELTERGFNVIVLEAGRDLEDKDFKPEAWERNAHPVANVPDFERQEIQKRHPVFNEANKHFFSDDIDNPYSHPPDKPFTWIRGRQVGGRSMVWAGHTWRLSDHEFKAASLDGWEIDWPLNHSDLDEYYEKVERFIHITGNADHLNEIPDSMITAMSRMTPHEQYFKNIVKSHWPNRNVVTTRSVLLKSLPEVFRGERKWPRFSSPGSTLAAALHTGRLTLLPYAAVSHLLLDASESIIRGVAYIDCKTGKIFEIESKATVLCASTLESTRIVLNTKSKKHPNGLGNKSGVLGKFLMDHVCLCMYGRYPTSLVNDGKNLGAFNERDYINSHFGVYIPRFSNLGKRTELFRRGYGIWCNLQEPKQQKGEGDFNLIMIGEMLPYRDNFVSLGNKTDAWSIPMLHIECSHRENEKKMTEQAIKDLAEIAIACGYQIGGVTNTLQPGLFVHEVGTARMGSNPKTSFLNANCQSWEIPNLFITDGACWPTSAYQNPTLTMMAITLRSAPHVAAEIAKR